MTDTTDSAQGNTVEAVKAGPEGAPQVETPESPQASPKEAPRDDEAPLETPESPAINADALIELKKDDLKEEAAAHDLPVSGTKSELVERIVAKVEATREEDTVDPLYDLHLSTSPVDSHAPVWLPREPYIS